MKLWQPTALALAVAAAFPGAALAQTAQDVSKEISELKARIAELEKKLAEGAAAGAAGAAGAAKPQWGMTPEQAAEFNRIAVKTEALEDQRDALGFKGLKVSGVIDLPFVWNQRRNTLGPQFLSSLDSDPYSYDSSYMGMVMLDILKETESGSRYRLTLAPRRGAGEVSGAGGIVHEASMSVPLTSDKVRFLAGQIPDWSGYEYLPANQNKLITHNLLFDFTLPAAYTGAGGEVAVDKWVVKGILGTVNASRKNPSNRTPALAYRADYARGEFTGFGFAGVFGEAPNFNDVAPDGSYNDSALTTFEVDGWYTRGDLAVMGPVSWGQQKRASITPDPVTGDLRDASWWGLSGLVAYKFMPRLEGIARGDYIDNSKNGGGLLGYTVGDDRNGIGPDPAGDPNVGANRYALTFGLNYLFNENTIFKVEYRHDRASQPVFLDVKSGEYKKDNNLLSAQAVLFW